MINSPIEENTHARALQGTDAEEEAWQQLENEQEQEAIELRIVKANTAAVQWVEELTPSELSLVTLRKAYASGYFDALIRRNRE